MMKRNMDSLDFVIVNFVLDLVCREIQCTHHAAWHAVKLCCLLIDSLSPTFDTKKEIHHIPLVAYWLEQYVLVHDERLCDADCPYEMIVAAKHRINHDEHIRFQTMLTHTLPYRLFEQAGDFNVSRLSDFCLPDTRRALLRDAFHVLSTNVEFRRETRRVLYEAYKIVKHFPAKQIHLNAFQNASYKAYQKKNNDQLATELEIGLRRKK